MWIQLFRDRIRMVAPEVWGPRLWRLLHGLADVSNRRDIYPLWNTFLRWTTAVIPCQKCQKHMGEYWSHTTFLPKGWNYMTGDQVRADIRAKLNLFHNNVNERLGKPTVSLVSLGDIDRPAIYRELQELFDGLREEWSSAHLEWKRTGAMLLQLVKGGPT
jgi:hypothetical protein